MEDGKLLGSQAWEKMAITSSLFCGRITLVPFIMRSLELSPISWKEECPCLSDEALWLVPWIPRLHKSLLIRARISRDPPRGHCWPGGSTEDEVLVTELPEVCASLGQALGSYSRAQRHL